MNRMHPPEGGERNYAPSGDDFEPLARDDIPVRSLRRDDLPSIVRIDRRITGSDRGDYYRRKLDEAIDESGIRVSLAAEIDDHVVGFIMARVDYGEFGQTATTAVIDTLAVHPDFAGQQVGSALVSQLLSNLDSLRVETVRTLVAWDDFGLAGFLDRCGFVPAQRLALRLPLN